MPARIVLVHDEPELLAAFEAKLRSTGHDVAAFRDSVSAFDALSSPRRVEILVTRLLFQPGRPHGLALAGAARMTRPLLKTIFLVRPDVLHHVADEDRVLVTPVSPDLVVQVVEELLNAPPVQGMQHWNGS